MLSQNKKNDYQLEMNTTDAYGNINTNTVNAIAASIENSGGNQHVLI